MLAAGFGAEGAGSRTPALARLRASGRPFASAYAPDPDPLRARSALVGTDRGALAALLRARGVDLLDLTLAESPADSAALARLETWIRERRRREVSPGLATHRSEDDEAVATLTDPRLEPRQGGGVGR